MIRADVYQPFFRKFLWVSLACTAFGGWCLYDGLIAYPKKLTIAEAYESLPEEGRSDAWKELAGEKGWPTKTPSKTAKDIQAQHRKPVHDAQLRRNLRDLCFPEIHLRPGHLGRGR